MWDFFGGSASHRMSNGCLVRIFYSVHGVDQVTIEYSKRWHAQMQSLRFSEELLPKVWETALGAGRESTGDMGSS